MTNDEIIAKTREFESDMRKNKALVTRLGNDAKNLDTRIKDNQTKLKEAQQLPHLVANVGEILDVEDDEADDTAGFK